MKEKIVNAVIENALDHAYLIAKQGKTAALVNVDGNKLDSIDFKTDPTFYGLGPVVWERNFEGMTEEEVEEAWPEIVEEIREALYNYLDQ